MLAHKSVPDSSPPVSDLLAKILKQLMQAEEQCEDIIVKTESRLALSKLVELFDKIQSGTMTASRDVVKVLLENYLKQRWDFIQGTDAAYPHSPLSLANRACYAIAQLLAEEDRTRSALSFLMPDVTIPKHLHQLKLHEFIITDDKVLISVLDALDAARLDDNYQFLYINSNGVTCKCTEADRDRISYHSDAARAYYQAYFSLPPSLDDSILEKDAISKGALKIALEEFTLGKTDRRTLHNLMASYSLGQETRAALVMALKNEHSVKSSYLKPGKVRLLELVLSNVTILQELADFMAKNLKKSEWKDFIQEIDNDSLYQIVLTIDVHGYKTRANGNDLQYNSFLTAAADRALTTKLKIDANSFNNECMARAFYLCLAEAYIRTRSDEPELKSSHSYGGGIFSRLASYAPSYTGAYVKTDKVSAGKELINFILEDHPLHDLEAYLTAKKLSAHWPVMISTGLLNDPSTLAKITKALIETGKNLLGKKMGPGGSKQH